MSRILTMLVTALLLALALVACGNKGPLVLPSPEETEVVPDAVDEAAVDEAEEATEDVPVDEANDGEPEIPSTTPDEPSRD